jgi:hypothetical protein
MARISLAGHWKFRRLTRAIAAQAPTDQITGAGIVARGLLEVLWEAGYGAVSDYIGTPEEIAETVQWRGDPIVLVTLLVDSGFLDVQPTGEYVIHDLWENAPRYAQLRRARKLSDKCRTLSDIASDIVGQKTTNVGHENSGLNFVSDICRTLSDVPVQSSPVQTREKGSAAVAARLPDEDDKPHPRHIVPLGYELVRQGRKFESDADAKEALKELAARYDIPYDASSITGALDLLKHAKAPLFLPRPHSSPLQPEGDTQ